MTPGIGTNTHHERIIGDKCDIKEVPTVQEEPQLANYVQLSEIIK